MVDVRVTNEKLRDRATRIVEQVAGAPREQAAAALDDAGDDAKVAITMLRAGVGADEARGAARRRRRPPAPRARRMRRSRESHTTVWKSTWVVGLMSGTSFDAIDAAVADIELEGDVAAAAAAGLAQRALRRRPARGDRRGAAARADHARDGVPARHPDRPGVRGARRGGDRPLRRRRPDRLARPDALSLGRRRPRARDAAGRPAGLDRRAHRRPGRLGPALPRRRRRRPGRAAGLAARRAAARRPPRRARGAEPRRHRERDDLGASRSRSTSGPATRSSTPPRATSPARPTTRTDGSPPPGASFPRCWTACSPTPTTPAPRPRAPARSTSTPPTSRTPCTTMRRDLLATLTRLTARTVAHATRGVSELVVSGGGVRNPALMAELAHRPTRP